jgi:hypothetical protein
MMMMAAVVVRRIGRHSSGPQRSRQRREAPAGPSAVGNVVNFAWTTARFLGMNGKFWGEPWGFEKTS